MKFKAAVLSFLLSGFAFAQITVSVGDFSKLEVFDRISAILIPSDKNMLEISGNKAEYVRYINRNGRLRIKMNIENILNGKDITVKVYFNELNSIFANTGTRITTEDIISSPSLTIKANQGSEIILNTETDMLKVNVNGGGKVELTGHTASQKIDSNSGGIYNGIELEAAVTDVSVKAGGEATVYCTGTVDAKTLAGGNIYIYGGADVTEKSTAGGNIYIRQ